MVLYINFSALKLKMKYNNLIKVSQIEDFLYTI